MKPPPFAYARPQSLPEILHLLAEHEGGARVLAGGQSLIPLLNFRLARPEVLIDVGLVEELGTIAVDNRMLRIGATVTQRSAETSQTVARNCPLLARALPHVGHLQNRIRGTVVGSIAHADPAAELPAVAVALDATMVVHSIRGQLHVPAREFFLAPFTTALEPDELLTEVRWPATPSTRAAVIEVAPRAGDFALAGVAATLALRPDRSVDQATFALFGVSGVPERLDEVEDLVSGQQITPPLLDEVTALTLATASVDAEDVNADVAYRRRVSGELVRRALQEIAA